MRAPDMNSTPVPRSLRWSAACAAIAAAVAMPHTGCLLTTPLDGLAGEPPVDDGGAGVDGCAPGTSDCDDTEGCETNTSTDAKNCGKCGRDCLEGSCENGTCKPIAMSGTSLAKSMAVDESRFYWINEQGAVQAAPKSGGSPTLIASGQSVGDSPSLVVDADAVYWATAITIMSALKKDSTLKTIASSQNKPKSVALNGAYVYWINDKSVMRASKAGGSPTAIATELLAPEQVKVDSSGVYWIVYGSNELRFVPLSGGEPTTLSAEYTGPKSLALDAASVFVAEHGQDGSGFNNGIISLVPKSGGGKLVLASTQSYPQGLDLDGDDVYWANFNGSAVVRVSKSAGTTPVKVADTPGPSMVVSPPFDSYVWWIGTNGISKVAK